MQSSPPPAAKELFLIAPFGSAVVASRLGQFCFYKRTDKMNLQDEQDLKTEIEHIFQSGANEIRIFEMAKVFIKKRYLSTGIIDRNGAEIFTGDAVKLHDKWDDVTTPYTTYLVKKSPLMVYFEVLEQSEKSRKICQKSKGGDANLGHWVHKYLIKV